ncbi:MAG: hypothetical protein KGL39_15055 [Patescibacteria group bacterium]|nr:hypothetical protein [Patescibacteria group bacterium]
MNDKIPQPKQRVITIENLQGGWVTDFTGANYPKEGAPNQYGYSFGMSTMRPGRKGHIAPAEIFNGASITDSSGDIDSLPRAVTFDNSAVPNTEWYLTGGLSGTAPKVVQVVSGAVTDSGSGVSQLPHTISAPSGNFTTIPTNGTGYWGEDILIYNGMTGTTTPVRYVLYSYSTSASGYVGVWTIDGGDVLTDNFLGNNSSYPQGGDATLPTANVPHRMCIGPDNIMYMTNGQYLASYDATPDQSASNGTWNHAALNLGFGWVATDVQPYGQEYVAISIVKTGTDSSGNTYFNGPQDCSDARVVLWNGSDLDFSQLYYLDDWYCSSLKEVDGVLYAFTEGRNGTTKVKVLQPWPPYFQTVWEQPTSIVGHAPLPNQVEYFNEMICWVAPMIGGVFVNGALNVYGLLPTQNGYTLHTPYFLYDGTNQLGGSPGLLKNTTGNKLFVGYNGTGYRLTGLVGDGQSNGSAYAGAFANNPPYTELRSVIQDNGYRGTIVGMKAYFSNFGSDSSMLISLLPNHTKYTDGGSGTITGDQLDWAISTTTHPNITNTLTASIAEIGGNRITDISEFWLNIRSTISSASANFPALRKLEITVEEVFKP